MSQIKSNLYIHFKSPLSVRSESGLSNLARPSHFSSFRDLKSQLPEFSAECVFLCHVIRCANLAEINREIFGP